MELDDDVVKICTKWQTFSYINFYLVIAYKEPKKDIVLLPPNCIDT